MNRFKRFNLLASAGLATGALFAGAAPDAAAVPVVAQYLEDPRCDALPAQTLSHELGDFGFFPPNEAISVLLVSTPNQTVCVPDDGVANDWLRQITNLTGTPWMDLYFVGDLFVKVGNADGSMMDVLGAPNVLTDAFKIDGTVTAGINNNLISESGPIDEIFDPGETWTFNVSNFTDAFGLAPPPTLTTPGQFAGSSPPNPGSHGNASIVAIPVPEPSTLGALTIAAAALLMRRRRRS